MYIEPVRLCSRQSAWMDAMFEIHQTSHVPRPGANVESSPGLLPPRWLCLFGVRSTWVPQSDPAHAAGHWRKVAHMARAIQCQTPRAVDWPNRNACSRTASGSYVVRVGAFPRGQIPSQSVFLMPAQVWHVWSQVVLSKMWRGMYCRRIEWLYRRNWGNTSIRCELWCSWVYAVKILASICLMHRLEW